MLDETRRRLFEGVLERLPGDRTLAAIPLKQVEIKELILEKFHNDELATVELLRRAGSAAAEVFTKLRLTREIIKTVLKELQGDRKLQVVFSNVVCATRFKFFEGGELLDTVCPKPGCGSVDSLEHLLSCTEMSTAPEEREELIAYLVELTVAACPEGSNVPVPDRPVEILLDIASDTDPETEEEGEQISYDVDVREESD